MTQRWRPVATAPEGEDVLLCTTGEHVGQAYWRMDPNADEDLPVWMWASGDTLHENHVPLGWQPMPRGLAEGGVVESSEPPASVEWTPLRRALWDVVTEAEINSGYKSAWQLTEALHSALLSLRPSTGRWSFDDHSIGWVEDGASSLRRGSTVLRRPPGLTSGAWYDHARDVCRLLPRCEEDLGASSRSL